MPNIEDTFAESLHLQILVLHQSLCIFEAGLSSLSDGGAKYTKEYLICQIPIKILKHHAIPKSSLQNLKIFLSKGYRKTSQKCNSVKDITSDYGFLLRLANAFTVDTEEYPLLKVHDVKTSKTL